MNWRHQLAVNKRKTYVLIFSFVLMYAVLGAVTSLLFTPHIGIGDWWSILSSSRSQHIILIFLMVSVIIILAAVLFGGKLSLAGTNAIQVTARSEEPEYKQLFNVVEEMKIAAGLRFLPKIYVMPVRYMNAFAAGWNEKNAIVAVTEPLLKALSREELQAVIAHELSHIRHQDTRVMTLVSVMAGLLVMIIDLLFRSLLYGGGRRRNRRSEVSSIMVIVVALLRLLLPILTSFMVMYVSRKRELLADAGCVELTRNKQALARALTKIHQVHTEHKDAMDEAYGDTPNEQVRHLAYIYGAKQHGFRRFMNFNEWFSTHPSLKERLTALGVEGENF